MPELALFADHIIAQLNEFPIDSLKTIEDALASANTESSGKLNLTMSIELANLDAYNKALAEILSTQ
jgi:hypothetical protein